MARQSVKTRDMIRLLERLGFSRRDGAAHYVFRREAEAPGEQPVIIVFARASELQPVVVAYVRRQLDETGLLAREDFARKIGEGSSKRAQVVRSLEP